MKQRHLFAAVLAAAVFIGVSAAGGPAEAHGRSAAGWVDVQGDPGHTGYQPNPGRLTVATVTRLATRWAARGWASRGPVAVAGSLYFPDNSGRGATLRRVDAGTGAARPFGATARFWIGQPVSDGSAIYAVTYDVFGVGQLRRYALDGSARWQTNLPGHNSGEYITTGAGLVYATSGSDCKYICGISRIQAYSADTGALVWQRDIVGSGEYERPILASGWLLWPTVTQGGWRITAFDIATGVEAWSRSGTGNLDGAAATGTTLYTVSKQLCAWSIATGEPRRCRTDRAYDTVAVSPFAVYATAGDTLVALRPGLSGASWTARVGGTAIFPPVIGGGVVYVGRSSAHSDVVAVNARTGAPLTTVPVLANGSAGELAFAGGRLYATVDFSIVALTP